MSPEAEKKLAEMLANGEMKVPRLFYMGHEVIATYSDQDPKWRCRDCKHEFVAYDGRKCPSCGSEKK